MNAYCIVSFDDLAVLVAGSGYQILVRRNDNFLSRCGLIRGLGLPVIIFHFPDADIKFPDIFVRVKFIST